MSVVVASLQGHLIGATAGYRHRSGIYAIIHRETGKLYVGSASCLKTRIGYHRSKLRHERHDNSYLQHAWNAHGEAAFDFVLIEECGRDALLAREGHWMAVTQCADRARGFNLDRIAQRKMHSEETRRKIAIGNTGKLFTAERRENISKGQRRRGGGYKLSLTPEQRANRADVARRNWSDPAIRAAMTDAKRGKTHTPATKKKISDFWAARRAMRQRGQLCLL